MRYLVCALGGALFGGVSGLAVKHFRDPRSEDVFSYAAAGALIGGFSGFGIPLLFWKSAKSLSLVQHYVSHMQGALNGALHKQGWSVRQLRVEGNIALLRLGETKGGRVVDLQRVFTSATEVQVRNWNAPATLLPAVYEAENVFFRQIGITTVHLHLPDESLRHIPNITAMEIFIEHFRLRGKVEIPSIGLQGEYAVFKL